MEKVTIDGEEWTVLSTGHTENGSTFVHLASTTRTHRQRNGTRPVQVCGWFNRNTGKLTTDSEAST